MKTHGLKVWPEYFKEIRSGNKTFEVRKNDRDFEMGDRLYLREFDPTKDRYTGRTLNATITYILKSPNPFIELGDFVVMSIKVQ